MLFITSISNLYSSDFFIDYHEFNSVITNKKIKNIEITEFQKDKKTNTKWKWILDYDIEGKLINSIRYTDSSVIKNSYINEKLNKTISTDSDKKETINSCRYEKKGNIEIQTNYENSKEKNKFYSEVLYDNNKKITKLVEYTRFNPTDPFTKNIFIYNYINNKLSEMRQYSINCDDIKDSNYSEKDISEIRKYNSMGQIIEWIFFLSDPDNPIRVANVKQCGFKTKYIYNKKGSIIEENKFSFEIKIIDGKEVIEEKFDSKKTYKYDQDDLRTEEINYNGNNEITGMYVYKYLFY